MAETICCLNHVDFCYVGDPQKRLVLRNLSWNIRKGEHTLLLGENGAGKTTLFRLIHGELWHCAGKVAWRTEEGMEDSRIAGRAVTAMVSPAMQERFQSYAWDISGRELLLSGFDGTALLYTPSTRERVAKVEELAKRIGAEELLDRSSLTFSQGQLRLLLLGRALIARPSLLLLDECTDGLDEKHRKLFLAALDEVKETSTVILTSHRESQIPDWCDRLRVMENACVSEERVRVRKEKKRERRLTLTELTAPLQKEALITLKNANVYIAGSLVLKDLFLSLCKGERWLLEGENGSGKSTLLRLLSGDENVAWPGEIRFDFQKEEGAIPLEVLRRKVRLVSDFSQACYGYDLSCLELVLSGFDNTVGLYRDFSEEEYAEARKQLERTGLADFADISIRKISTGQERRLFLARALVGSPELLLLDEPCSGLDEEAREVYLQVLDKLAEEGLQYVFVSHFTEDTPASVNKRAHMSEGRLVILQ